MASHFLFGGAGDGTQDVTNCEASATILRTCTQLLILLRMKGEVLTYHSVIGNVYDGKNGF
jgi:hypothetical protein